MIDFVDECQNPRVCAAVLATSDVGRGMSKYFEKTTNFLLPTDSVAKKRNKKWCYI